MNPDFENEARTLEANLLLAMAEGGAGIRDAVVRHLQPGDFHEGPARVEFCRLAALNRTENEEATAENEPATARFEHMARRFVRLSMLVRIRNLAQKALDQAGPETIETVLEDLSLQTASMLRRIAAAKTGEAVWQDSRKRLMGTLDAMKDLMLSDLRKSPVRMSWVGLEELDLLAGPPHPGCLHLIASAPGIGKTAFAIAMVRHAARLKNKTGFLALRDAEKTLSLRFLSGEGRMVPQRMFRGRWSHARGGMFEKLRDLVYQIGEFVEAFPIIASLPNAGTALIGEFSREWIHGQNFALLVIDDLDFATEQGAADPLSALPERVAVLRHLAEACAIPIVATVTLPITPPTAESPTPAPAAMAATFARSLPADFVALLTGPVSGEECGVHEIHVVHNAFGPTFSLPVLYNHQTQLFHELALEHSD